MNEGKFKSVCQIDQENVCYIERVHQECDQEGVYLFKRVCVVSNG